MGKVCVITGGGSGMGLATAKLIGKDHHVIIVGRTLSKLEAALAELKADGITAESYACDISEREAVDKLAAYAKSKGTIASVIHSAGMSPHMGDALTIMKVNALGTITINEAFYDVMEEGSAIVDVSSMSAYMAPKALMPTKKYRLSRTDKTKFMKKMMGRVNLFPRKLRSQLAYVISKNFVVWYAITDAAKFGQKGIRVLSVSPGSFETPMGEVERADAEAFIKDCAIKRFGKVEEIASVLAFVVSPEAGYLTGTDIICDGGCIGGRNNK